jgi:hypothetical protein
MNKWNLVGLSLLALSACATEEPAYQAQTYPQQSYTQAQPYTPPEGVQPIVVQGDWIQPGTRLVVQLDSSLGTQYSQYGQPYTAHVAVPVVDQNGQTVIPAGSPISGRVVAVQEGQGGQPATIQLTADSVTLGGVQHPISAHIVAADVEASHRGIKGSHVLAGAAGGAVLGGVLAQSARGALIGGALGAGAGALISLGTSKTEANLPAGTAMAIEFDQAINVASLRGPRQATGYPPN